MTWSEQFTTHHPCRICDQEAVAVEDEGWVCADHRNPSGLAKNQIAGSGSHRELLEALTDAQLDEQIAYYRESMERSDDTFGHWKLSTLLSTAMQVRHDRLQSGSNAPA